MSYSIHIVDPETKEDIVVDKPHGIIGGTYCVGDTSLYLNVTYNYSGFYGRPEVLGATAEEREANDEDWIRENTGLRRLRNKTAEEAIPLLLEAIKHLKSEDIDNKGKPYDMVSKYDEETLQEIQELEDAIAQKGLAYVDQLELLNKKDFILKFHQRPLGYWAPTERNAKTALINLLSLVNLAPANAIITID
jgi:hypothetical protein